MSDASAPKKPIPKRTPTPVDQTLLTQCVKEAEKDGPCATQSTMLKAAANLYNSRLPSGGKAISFVIVRLRIGEWSIPHVSMPQIKPINRGGGRK